jgi:hypothetical protein
MNVTNVIRSHESVGLTAALRAPRPANTVRIGLGGAGDVVVDDVRHLIDVDTTRNNVGGHKDVESALTKALHGAISLSLGHVPLQCDRLVILAIEFLRETLGAVLGPRENNGRVESVFFEKLVEQIDLAILNDGIERVFDGFSGSSVGQLDHPRIVEDDIREPSNLLRHRRGKQQILARIRQCFDDTANIRQESHIKHVVSLVKDQRLQRFEGHFTAAHEIQKTTGASNDHIRSTTKLRYLRALRDAAVDADRLDTRRPGESAELLFDLKHELTSRSDHQSARSPSWPAQYRLEYG